MRVLLTMIALLSFVLFPVISFSETQAAKAPIAQPLVREGTLAVKLVTAFKLGTTSDEAAAESLLTSAGVVPRNGWIADYPVTPDIAGELRSSITSAADAKVLTIDLNSALVAFDSTMRDYGLAVRAGDSKNADNAYPDSTVINNYYYDEGPPVVTYYAPPADYAYLYTWVPYPFWWFDVAFPGFFILVNFHRPIIVNRTVVIVSNHFFNPVTRTFVSVNPVRRFTVSAAVTTRTVIGPSMVRTVRARPPGFTSRGRTVTRSAPGRNFNTARFNGSFASGRSFGGSASGSSFHRM